MKKYAMVGAAVVLLLLLTGVLFFLAPPTKNADTSQHFSAQNLPLTNAPQGVNANAAVASNVAGDSVAHVNTVLTSGSLRGTSMDGSWGKWLNGKLIPDLSLRKRFDYLLTMQGEATLAQLRVWVVDATTRDLGADKSAQILNIWDKYVKLQAYEYKTKMDLNSPMRWGDLLKEQHQVRIDLLGADWAAAFYSEDELAFKHTIDREMNAKNGKGEGPLSKTIPLVSDQPDALLMPPNNLNAEQKKELYQLRVQQFGQAAADRLARNDTEWDAWQERLAAAKVEIDKIGSNAALSPQQIRAQQEAAIRKNFTGTEATRAISLLVDKL